jgi:hypothetical protein
MCIVLDLHIWHAGIVVGMAFICSIGIAPSSAQAEGSNVNATATVATTAKPVTILRMLITKLLVPRASSIFLGIQPHQAAGASPGATFYACRSLFVRQGSLNDDTSKQNHRR